MRIKLSDIISNSQNLQQLQDLKLPVKVSYRLKRLVDKLTPLLKSYNEERNEMIKELGEEDPKTKVFTVKKENEKEFYDKLEKLMEVEEEVDFKKIKIAELGAISIEPKLLLDFVFEE